MDLNDVDMKNLPFVPDFIWASPPCQTYSRLAGGLHRNPKQGDLEKSVLARNHNHLFLKMTAIIQWAKRLHPHLIVIIENPVGALQQMPLMQDFEKTFNLKRSTVNYCAFGRDELKPTHLWTNDCELSRRLNEFTCQKMCPHGRGNHPGGVQSSASLDHSAIPEQLAEEVVDYVHAKLYFADIRRTPAALPTENGG